MKQTKQTRYKYVLINKKGREEPWTGLFGSKEKCEKWFEKWGKIHIEQGYNIKLKKTRVWRQTVLNTSEK